MVPAGPDVYALSMVDFSLAMALEVAIWLLNNSLVAMMLAVGATVGATVIIWLVDRAGVEV